MSRSYLPPRDLGPEFCRRLDHEVLAFARRMFAIGRGCTRFERAEQIQAEADRLLGITDEEAGHVVLP